MRLLYPLLLLPLIACGKNEPVVDRDQDGSPAEEDCDDEDPLTYPGAPELCDNLDNDCDGEIPTDEFIDGDLDTWVGCEDCDDTDPSLQPGTYWYADLDGDGYGDNGNVLEQCEREEGYVSNNLDCDDGDPTRNPDTTWFADNDSDGYGDPESSLRTCEQLPGYVLADQEDCDDDDPTEHPGQLWYYDADGDGYGDESVVTESCSQPPDYVLGPPDGPDFDCDDEVSTTWPGAAEACNEVDDDCDGVVPETEYDLDGDGTSACQGDPDDGDGGVTSSAEYTIGGGSASWSESGYFRGNVYTTQVAKTLLSFSMGLEASSPFCEADFYVLQGESPSGPWETVWVGTRSVPGGGSGKGRMVSSGDIDLNLAAGVSYTLGAGWTCEVTYYADQTDLSGAEVGIGVFEGRTTWDNEYTGFSEDYAPERSGNADTVYQQTIVLNY
jgi:hypothetical protein